jgi:F-box/TPR repeat protein Pof3
MLSGPIFDFCDLKHVESLDLSNGNLQEIPNLPATLKHLKLSKMRHMGAHDDVDKIYELPLLETFDCSGTAISGSLLKAMTLQSIKAGNLKTLYMGDRLVDFAPGTPVEDEFPASNSVEELSIASLIIRERRILEVIKLFPNLQRLDVSGTKVTGVAVKKFVALGIKWLKLDECSEVSPDAVEYARGKDVEVEFNFPSRSGRVTSFRDASYTGVF